MIVPIVRATTRFLPPEVVDNAAIGERLIAGANGTASPDEIRRTRERATVIEKKTGLRERRFFAPGDDPVEAALARAEALLDAANMPWSALDGLIVSSSSVHGFPGLSQQVVARARARHAGVGAPLVLDIGSNACTGFMYALGTAASFVRSRQCRTVACVAVEFSSRCLDYHPRAFGTSTLFGDATAGVLVSAEGTAKARVVSVHLGSHLDEEKIGYVRGSGMEACDLAAPVPANARWFMSGPPVAIGAIEILRNEIRRYRDGEGRVDWLIPHQANLTRILYPACDELGIPRDRLCASFERTGNTSSASIPLLLDELLASGRARSGDRVVLVGFGASFSIGSALLEIA